MSIAAILFILGWLIGAFGLIMLIPALVSALTSHIATEAFLFSSVASIFVGGGLVFMNRTENLFLRHKDAFFLTFLTWFLISLFGAFPFYLSGITPNFMDALFESASGITTTGATVLVGLDYMDKGILIWRAILQWLGGMGVIVLATAILPFLGVGGLQLYKAEMPGVVKDKLQPRLKETAEILWIVYLVLTVACAVCYFLGGMTVFDAVCHAFTTLATGGYSTHDASFGHFKSPLLDGIAIFFMILGGLNFSLHYMFLSKRNLSYYTHNLEVRMFVFFIFVIAILATFSLMQGNLFGSYSEAFRYALFNTTSAVTTTGYGTTDYSLWPVHILILFVLMMFLGGCSGSTSGGLKFMRVILVGRFGWREVMRTIHPRAVLPLKMSGQVISPNVIQSVWGFVGLYIISFVVVTFLLAFAGMDMVSAFSASAAALSSLGPALGEVGPASTYTNVSEFAKAVLIFAMILGRLEIITLLIIFTPQFWRK